MKRRLRYYTLFLAMAPALLQPGCAGISDAPRARESANAEGALPRHEGVALHEITSVIPTSRVDTAWWAERFEKLNALVKKDKYPLIFIGDSI